MLGLRVNRLQPRPSLLDLISSATTTASPALPPASAANLPPLPDSPTTTSTSPVSITTPTSPTLSTTHENQNSVSPVPPSIPHPIHPPSRTMAPAKGNATEEHGSIFSVSGSVVVAENMIGCAMYELVSCVIVQCPMMFDGLTGLVVPCRSSAAGWRGYPC